MHAVIVSEEPCYPPNAGNRIRTLNLMLHLARRHRITYICRDQGTGTAEEARTYLQGHGIETIVVPDPIHASKGPFYYFRLAANLLSRVPYSVKRHNSSRIHQAMRELAGRDPVDLWQFEWLPYLDGLQGLPGSRSVMIAHNVEALIWQRYHETETQPLKRWYIRRQWRKMQTFERRIYHQATKVVAVSDEDANLIQRLYGVPHVAVVDNGVDNAHFQAILAERNPKQILFLGALDYRPNQDAVRLLLDDVFPAVQARHPDARLVLVGRNPPDWLRQRVTGLSPVELHGDVPDVRPYLASSGLMAVPLRVGGGSRLKILEALAAGLPVVATAVGAEGLHLTAGRDLVLVERTEEMARALIQALDEPAALQRIAEQGRQVVQQRYDWSVLAEKLEQVWLECAGGPRA